MAVKTNFKVNPETGKQDIKLGVDYHYYDGHSAVIVLDKLRDDGKTFDVKFFAQGKLIATTCGKIFHYTVDFAHIVAVACYSQMYITINTYLNITAFNDSTVDYVINTSEGYYELNEI